MQSMTGFGRGGAEGEGVRVQVEAGSVNRKNLDVQVSLPRGMSALETICQKHVSSVCRRGRIQLRVELECLNGEEVQLDQPRASQLLDELNRFAAEKGLRKIEEVERLLVLPGLWKEVSIVDTEKVTSVLERAVSIAVQELNDMRSREGSHLAAVLLQEVEILEQLLEQAEPLLTEAKDALEKRFRSAVDLIGEAGPEVEQRVLQEMALLAEKADVQEEFERLRGHVEHFRDKVQAEGPVGRALDFLCQEMAREWHTLSVKTSHAGLNHLALQGKEGVERLREQVQNVE